MSKSAKRLGSSPQRIYNHLKSIAARGAPAPTISQFEILLNLSRSAVVHALKELFDRDLVREEIDPLVTTKRRFFLPEIERRTAYSVRINSASNHNRECITGCGRSFHSEGPHHRMCQHCRSSSDHALLNPRGAVATTHRTALLPQT